MSSLLVLVFVIVNIAYRHVNGRDALVGYGGMTASAHFDATQAGLSILEQGGTAADAAVAIQLSLNVVQPHKSGIGGGCFIMYYDATENEVFSIDAREEAPNDYHGNIFCKNPDCFRNFDCSTCGSTMSNTEKRVGGLSVGSPGTLYGLHRLYKYFGGGKYDNGISWNDLFQPAISLAEDGFTMYSELYNNINGNSNLRRWAGQDLFFRDGSSTPKASVGETFTNPELAETFKLLSAGDEDNAIDVFYNGEIGKDILDAVVQCENTVTYNSQTTYRHGLMTADDLAGYSAVFRDPVHATFELDGYEMYGMGMPSSGGTTVIQMMQMLDIWERDNPLLPSLSDADWFSGEAAHYQISANNVAWPDRNQYMADADFIDVPQAGLVNPEYVESRVSEFFGLSRISTPIPHGEPPGVTYDNIYNQTSIIGEEHGTTHFFAMDQYGNMAVITTTIESNFGSCVIVPGRGFVLNNELTDFDSLGYDGNVKVANGPEGGKALRRTAVGKFGLRDDLTYGGKRPRSSMSPSMALDQNGLPIFSAGSPGGQTIIGTVFGVMYNALIRDIDIQESIDLSRIWSYNGVTSSGEWSGFRSYNHQFDDQMSARGYGGIQLTPSSGGRCHGVKVRRNNQGLLVFYGGADDTRWATAKVDVLCKGDRGETDPLDDSTQFCRDINAGLIAAVKTNGDKANINIILTFIISLLCALFC